MQKRSRNFGRADRIRKSIMGSKSGATAEPMPEGLVFYCKTCERLIDLKPKTFDFTVPKELCGLGEGRNEAARDDEEEEKDGRRRRERTCEIVYGTERSIKQYYKIKDDRFDKERLEAEEKTRRAEKL